ncbi:hypothetical protein SBBP1_1300011 [Burkholderiales bacterium]|nr:hypothetical protein SBBP1_1300011 [Burkholderiales bacterium]
MFAPRLRWVWRGYDLKGVTHEEFEEVFNRRTRFPQSGDQTRRLRRPPVRVRWDLPSPFSCCSSNWCACCS